MDLLEFSSPADRAEDLIRFVATNPDVLGALANSFGGSKFDALLRDVLERSDLIFRPENSDEGSSIQCEGFRCARGARKPSQIPRAGAEPHAASPADISPAFPLLLRPPALSHRLLSRRRHRWCLHADALAARLRRRGGARCARRAHGRRRRGLDGRQVRAAPPAHVRCPTSCVADWGWRMGVLRAFGCPLGTNSTPLSIFSHTTTPLPPPLLGLSSLTNV
jgi:hypothetical protein